MELAETRHLSTFAQLVRVAGLEDTLNSFGDYTIFAPSEAAWYCKCKFQFVIRL